MPYTEKKNGSIIKYICYIYIRTLYFVTEDLIRKFLKEKPAKKNCYILSNKIRRPIYL